MLFNFCDSRLRPEVQCSTVSTEGYEATNLINDSDKGFLAYACIKPPVNIDITFLCNVHINHILIWPQVGSQKSSGFQLYAKTSNDVSMPYTLLATGFLDHSNAGLLFYPSHINHKTIPVSPNFLKRYIKPSMQYLTSYTSTIRICICKTENSVPALGKIQVWGTVSPRCGKDTVASICTLWFKQESLQSESVKVPESNNTTVNIVHNKKILDSSLEVPECFLDAITWEIMTQPILLPSGKIIDQTTLQKHEETEALWGRSLTDPFTGMPFSEDRKPVIANALKARIDKFLLENSTAEEIKRLPRVLGRSLSSSMANKKVLEVPKYLLNGDVVNKNVNHTKSKEQYRVTNSQESKKFCHKLPVIVMTNKRNGSTLSKVVKKTKTDGSNVLLGKGTDSNGMKNARTDVIDLTNDSNVNVNIKTAVPHLERFSSISEVYTGSSCSNSCSCCSNGTFYQLPCKHVLCRKVLTSLEDNRCIACSTVYDNSEVQRIYQ